MLPKAIGATRHDLLILYWYPGPGDPGQPRLTWPDASSTVLVIPRRLPSSGAGSGKNLARARRPGRPCGPGQQTDSTLMIMKPSQESHGRWSAPGRGGQQAEAHPGAGAVAPDHARDGSYASWGSCRCRAASSVPVTRSVSPGLASTRAAASSRWTSPRTTDGVRFAAGRDPGPGDRSVVGGAAPRDGGRGSRGVATSGSPAHPSSAGLFSADAAATGYRPLRLNSSRWASNQAMTSLRFQRLCLPIL